MKYQTVQLKSPAILPNQPNIQEEAEITILPKEPLSQGEAEIKKFHVNSNIQMRYAITDVETEMQNIYSDTREVTFDMFIPKEAFISKFSMVINGRTYQAKVKTKQIAKNIFTSSRVTSGLIQSNTQPEFIDGKMVRESIIWNMFMFFLKLAVIIDKQDLCWEFAMCSTKENL